jgi:hypothetical protein
MPLFICELHTLPIVVARGILETELDAPWLRGRALRICNVSLKLDGVGSSIGDGINKGVGHTQASVMTLRDFTYDQTMGI